MRLLFLFVLLALGSCGEPDIIHIVDWVNFNPSILDALKEFNVPIIKHVYNFEDFCYFISPIYKNKDQSYCTAPLSIDECAKCIQAYSYKNKKFLSKIKYLFLNKNKKDFTYYKKGLQNRRDIVIKNTDNFFDHLIFPSQSFADYYFSHLIKEKSFSVISHGINTSNSLKKNISSKKIKCVFTGGADLKKGWKIVEEVFEKLLNDFQDKIQLRIYGDKKKTIKSKLKKFPSVEFFESFKPNQIEQIMTWADIGIAPSHFETYSRVVREFVNFGVVPISTNAFGVAELINSNKNGIILDKPLSKNLFYIMSKIINEPNFLKSLQIGVKDSKIISKEEEFKSIFKLYKDLIIN